MYRLRPMNPDQMRQVDAAVVLEGGFDANRYPFRHLGVAAACAPREPLQGMSAALAAAELLAQNGWELVNVTSTENDTLLVVVAIMRRQ